MSAEAELFHAVIDLPAEAARRALDASDAPATVKARVRRLLDASAERGGAVDALLHGATPREAPPEGRRLGPFVLLERLGEGGMGEVFLARRDGEFSSPVALKLLRGGGTWSRERFDTERAVLAQLEHPAIARLLEGGTIESTKQPYFTMERVQGVPITEHCRQRQSSLRERIALFARACEAVAYAQQRLVVHRDLKPAHILITPEGEPKLLDFGIAKVLAPDAADTRALPGLVSPGYGAPEQIRGESVTTATDVFALGATLFELLTERPAFAGDTAEARLRASLDGLRALPSRSVGPDLPYPGRALRGDLDRVIQTALASDPDDRYPTAAALLDDLRRFEAGFPIRARAASWRAQVAKFVGRHRGPLAIAGAAVIALVGAGVTSAWQISQARARAEQEAARASAVAGFLTGLFEGSDPRRASRADTTARELLRYGARRIEGELSEAPGLRAQLLGAIGRAERGLGAFEQASDHLEAALALTEPGTLEHTRQRVLLAELASARGDHDAAIAGFEAALPELEVDGASPLERAEARRLFGQTLTSAGRFDQAEQVLERVVEDMRGLDDPLLGASLRDLGLLRHEQNRYPEAEANYRESLELLTRTRGEETPEVAATLFHLSQLLRDDARFDEARVTSERALALDRTIYGEAHPMVALSMTNLGMLLLQLGEVDKAEALITDALALRRRLLPAGHPDIGRSLTQLARLLHEQGRYEEAEARYREALALQRESLGAEHPLVAGRLNNLSWILYDRGAYEEARQAAERGLALNVKTRGDASMSTAISRLHLGRALIGLGRGGDALSALDPALATGLRLYGERHPFPAAVRRERGQALLRQGRLAEAEVEARAALERLDGLVSPRHPRVSEAKLGLAQVLAAGGQRPEAHRQWAEALEARQADLRPGHPQLERIRALEPR